MGFVFSDFGPRFTVRDVTGENPVTRSVRRQGGYPALMCLAEPNVPF